MRSIDSTAFALKNGLSTRLSSSKDFLSATSSDKPSALSSAFDAFEFSSLEPFFKAAVPTVVGTLTFAASLSLSTFLQFRLLKISTSTPTPIPSLIGIGSVAAAALVSHVFSVKAFEVINNSYSEGNYVGHYNTHTGITMGNLFTMPIDMNLFDERNLSHAVRVCIVGIVAYKGLGGRFWSISPSSLTHLGSFARNIFSLPASSRYATKGERHTIEKLGRAIGCHTCGSREIFGRAKGQNGVRFIADHMPPQSVVKQMNSRWHRKIWGKYGVVKQRFFPQCVTCSNKQGGILSRAVLETSKNLSTSGGGANAHFHGRRLRKEHLAGGALAALTLFGAKDRDIFRNGGGNRARFKRIQGEVVENMTDVWDYTRKVIKPKF